MQIKQVALRPAGSEAGALIRVDADLAYEPATELPIATTGQLLTKTGGYIARLGECAWPAMNWGLQGRSDTNQRREGALRLELAAELTPRQVVRLEELRSEDPKGDLVVTCRIATRFLQSDACVAYLEQFGDARAGQDGGGQIWEVVERDAPARNTRKFLYEERSGYVLKAGTHSQDLPVRVPGTDWVHDFAPTLGLGRFVVFEIPRTETFTSRGDIKDEVNAALESAAKAHESLVAGEWDDVMEDLRGVWELTRSKADEIKALLIRDGYTEEAAVAFADAIGRHFVLASKFHHRLDKQGKKITPEIKAAKEDAYLVYAVAMSVLNLIARKVQRLQ